MSGVKNWLMEMQEHSHYLIDTMQVDEARKHFINKYVFFKIYSQKSINCINKRIYEAYF